MRKLGFMLCITLAVALSACGKAEDNNGVANTSAPTQTENNGQTAVEATKAPVDDKQI